jgi:hypothetical protein
MEEKFPFFLNHFIERAKECFSAWDFISHLCADFMFTKIEIPNKLFDISQFVFRNQNKRPTKSDSSISRNKLRDHRIGTMLLGLKLFGYDPMTRNSASDEYSGCDIVAKIYSKRVEYIPYHTVETIWKKINKDFKKFENISKIYFKKSCR